jgi:hypothetical protein
MKKAQTITIIILVFLSLAIISFCVAFLMVIPAYLEKKLLPDLAQQVGIEGFSLNVRRIGFTQADFETVTIGGKPLKPFSISSIRINYSLSGLIRGHLKSIYICGLSLPIELKEGKILFPGIDLNKILSERNASAENKVRAKPSLPMTFDRIFIEHAVIIVKVNQHMLRLPLDVTLLPLDQDLNLLQCVIHFYPFQSPIHVEARIDLDSGNLKIFCDTQHLRLENFPLYLTSDKSLQAKGAIDFTAYTEIDFDAVETSTVNILMESLDFLFISETLKLEKSNEKNEALSIRIESEGLDNWKISTSGMTVTSPVLMEIPQIQADLRTVRDGLECHFQMDTILKSFNNPKLEINPPFHRQWSGSAKYFFNNTDWLIDMEIMSPEALADKQSSGWYRITSADMDVGFFIPNAKLSGEGNLEKGHADADLKLAGIYMDTHAVSVELPTVVLNAEMILDVKEDEKVKNLNFQVRFMNTGIRFGAANANFPDISLTGQTGWSGLENVIHGTLKIEDGDLLDTMHDAGIQGITLELPLVWPPTHKADEGSLEIGALMLKEKNLGKIKATLRQDGHGGEIKGAYDSRLFPGLILHFDGNGINSRKGLETRFQFEIPTYKIPKNFDLGDFFPDADEIFVDGRITVNGDFYKSGSKMTSSVHINTQNVNISMKGPELAVNNVQIDFTLADLFELRSLPHQHIQFDTASVGNIKLNDGSIYFQMQSVDRFFIEKTSFKWCGGNVDTNAAILSIPIENIGLTFYCDRLKLAEVLEQLGGFKGEGEGTVNGRIPIRYDNGKIRFDQGFLYSTPGDSGTIRLTGTDILMAGIPAGTPQFSQIDLAREALKDYRYDWAKLDINTERENLNLELKLDGKPVGVLPFEYRQEFGGFVRVDEDSPGSRFQGIRLDVNFNLPLDQVLQYGKGLQDIFKINN